MKKIISYTLIYLLISCNPAENRQNQNTLDIKKDSSSISLISDGQLILQYHTSTVYPADTLPEYFKRSGHVHPLNTPQGIMITDAFPEGHTHQHGLFMTWVKLHYKNEQLDFWNQQDETGTVRHVKLLETFTKPEKVSFTAELEHLSLKNGPVIKEQRTYQLSKHDKYNIIDITSMQTAASSDTVFLDQYHYGGFAFRGSANWNTAGSTFIDSMKVITSQGIQRKNANHTRPDWIAAFGSTNNGVGGVAIFGHPSNVRYPQPIRVHPVMPYFVFSPIQLGEMMILPSQKYISRYRVMPFDGEPDIELIKKIWEEYKSTKEL